jgi:phospholipid/cholesterol/gamma-HCH transport system substrate-binding protein
MKKHEPLAPQSREPLYRRHRNFFVGLFILVPLIVLPGFLVYTMVKTAYIEKGSRLYVRYDNAAGLGKNAAVTILGMKVGFVESVVLSRGRSIDVTMTIKREYVRFVKKDCIARLQQKNVAFGDWEIELAGGGENSSSAKTGDTLVGEVQAPIAKTLEQVSKTIDIFQKILQNISDGKGTVGRILKEDTLVTLAQDIGRKAAGLINRAAGTLDFADTVLVKVSSIGEKSKQVADSVVEITGKISKLMTDVNTLVAGLQTTSKDLPGIMAKVQTDISEVELMLKALQNNWLLKSSINGQKDPLLKEDK